MPTNFDNFITAVYTLFECATLEGWVDVFHRATDMTVINSGRCRFANITFATIFFVVYIFVCAFFALNLFMSVVIEHFYQELDRYATLRKRQD